MARIPTWLPQIALVAASVMALTATAVAAEKPNILVIFGDTVDIRGLVANHAHGIGADIGLPDVIAEDHQDIRLLGGCEIGRAHV